MNLAINVFEGSVFPPSCMSEVVKREETGIAGNPKLAAMSEMVSVFHSRRTEPDASGTLNSMLLQL